MRPISRRLALQLGGLGLLSAAVGGTGLAWPRDELPGPQAGGQLPEPEALRSADGLLRVRLEAAEGPLTVAGRRHSVRHFAHPGIA